LTSRNLGFHGFHLHGVFVEQNWAFREKHESFSKLNVAKLFLVDKTVYCSPTKMETLTYETKYYFCRTSQPNEKYWSHTEFLNPYFVG
jgi:hypothetical protein